MENEIKKTFYTVPETAQLLDLSVETIYKYIQRNKIKSYKRGGRRYIFQEDIESYVRGEYTPDE